MRLRILAILVILFAIYQSASAAVIHIGQRDTVYYGDVVDLRGITGWTDTLAWWAANHDPSVDTPDAVLDVLNATNCHKVLAGECANFTVTSDLHAGMWFQWYGNNERVQVAVFIVVPHARPAAAVPSPVPALTPAPLAYTREQPAPIADVLIARGDNLTYDTGGDCQLWLLGPTLQVIGERTVENAYNLTPVSLAAGTYALLLQYPDANGIYEVFNDGGKVVNSTWKDVPGFWYEPLEASVLKDKLMAMFGDPAHFHGKVVEKKIIVKEQGVDVSSLGETVSGSVVVKGITDLARNDTITAVWDADRNVIETDRAHNTFTARATGDDPGAYRVWQAVLPVNLQGQALGNHHVTLFTPDGHESTVEFYVSDAFAPFPTPETHIKYVNLSPFIEAPTPVIVEKEVPVTVVQTVMVQVTPAYETVLAAQNEAAATQRRALEGSILSWVFGGAFLVLGGFVVYRGRRYLKDVARRAREK